MTRPQRRRLEEDVKERPTATTSPKDAALCKAQQARASVSLLSQAAVEEYGLQLKNGLCGGDGMRRMAKSCLEANCLRGGGP